MKIRKELWFGFSLMGLIILAALGMLLGAEKISNGHIGLLMLSLVVVAIMLGFPTAFTLMGMGMIFTWIAYEENTTKTLDLMVSAAFKVMSNDVLISIPLFVFMGYLVERANLIEKLFRSLHLALARLPGALAVATLVTCAVFATATGIVGAVVTLMGLLALPQMLRAGYDVKLSAGAITAGGCLGILIPPSVMLIVYGATAGVSVVQLYAGAFFPGLMLAGLYIVYVIVVAKFKPHMAPPLSEKERYIPLPPLLEKIAPSHSARALPALLKALKGRSNADVPTSYILKQLGVVLAPLVLFAFVALWSYASVTSVPPVEEVSTLQSMGDGEEAAGQAADEDSLAAPPGGDADDAKEAPGAAAAVKAEADAKESAAAAPAAAVAPAATSQPAPAGYWIGVGVGALAML
ncbi:MAG: TRAP transporter large permease subunit, partial [Hylemonella sp.]